MGRRSITCGGGEQTGYDKVDIVKGTYPSYENCILILSIPASISCIISCYSIVLASRGPLEQVLIGSLTGG